MPPRMVVMRSAFSYLVISILPLRLLHQAGRWVDEKANSLSQPLFDTDTMDLFLGL